MAGSHEVRMDIDFLWRRLVSGSNVSMDDIHALLSDLNERVILLEEVRAKRRPEKWPMEPYRDAFKTGWERRYGRAYPKWSVKENSILKRFVQSVGREEAPKLIEAYIQWNDPFVVRCGHTLELLSAKVVELSVWMHDPGRMQAQISHANSVRTDLNQREEIAQHVRRIEGGPAPGRNAALGREVPIPAALQVPGPRGGRVPEDEGDHG